MQKARIAVVLGMHRSGTSAVTEYVSSLGFDVPGYQLEFHQEVNERGFWESQQIVTFNEGLLERLGLSWYSLREFSAWDIIDETVWLEMVCWLNDQLRQSSNLVIKDPRINILLPVWQKIFSRIDADVFYINVNRHPDSVVQSIEKRDGFGCAVGFALWLKYTLKPFEFILSEDCFFINYENLINHGLNILRDLAGYLGSASDGNFSVVEPRLARNNNRIQYSTEIAESARFVYEVLLNFSGCIHLNKEVSKDFLSELSNCYKLDAVSLTALDEVVSGLVSARKSMIENGASYTEALSVIEEKEISLSKVSSQLTVLEAELAIYQQGITRIREIFYVGDEAGILSAQRVSDVDLSSNFGVVPSDLIGAEGVGLYHDVARLIDAVERNRCILIECEAEINRLNRLLEVNEIDRKHNEDYIASCHDRIYFLEGVIKEKTHGEERNAVYIEACNNELSRLVGVVRTKEQGELDNVQYIARCHEEISRLNGILLDKELGEENNYNYIEKCHVRIAEIEKDLLISEEYKENIKSILKERSFEFLDADDLSHQIMVHVLSLLDEREKIISLNYAYKESMQVFASDISIRVEDLSLSSLDEVECFLFDVRCKLLSILNDKELLVNQLNAVLTELSVLALRAGRMELAITKIKSKPFLAKLHNNILNGL